MIPIFLFFHYEASLPRVFSTAFRFSWRTGKFSASLKTGIMIDNIVLVVEYSCKSYLKMDRVAPGELVKPGCA